MKSLRLTSPNHHQRDRMYLFNSGVYLTAAVWEVLPYKRIPYITGGCHVALIYVHTHTMINLFNGLLKIGSE